MHFIRYALCFISLQLSDGVLEIQGNQLTRDLNSVIATGKNWSVPFFWAPVIRYISCPILHHHVFRVSGFLQIADGPSAYLYIRSCACDNGYCGGWPHLPTGI
ncbi:hypothetical protein J3459_017376 [Metarhizium acridum]|nr:hypothetical protein J3459_017376 [Metarhizium acridum]